MPFRECHTVRIDFILLFSLRSQPEERIKSGRECLYGCEASEIVSYKDRMALERPFCSPEAQPTTMIVIHPTHKKIHSLFETYPHDEGQNVCAEHATRDQHWDMAKNMENITD
jgi:hypothetical protein